MRIAVVSDLHSNKEAADAVFAHLRAQGVDSLVCLGDIVGYGPDPEHCVDLVRGHAEVSVLGNHDEALFHDAADFNPHARTAIDWTRERLRPRWWHSSERKGRWRWLHELGLRHRIDRFHFVHGSTRDPVREYVLSTDGFLNPTKLRAIFDSFEGVVLCGHTHHPGIHTEDLRFRGLEGADELTVDLPPSEKCIVNVGSVGQPRDGDNRASYVILEDERLTWHRVAYDFRATMEKILATGKLSEMLARRLALGK
ncbi:MAG: metallophosphoesterase family protein [Planctomycetota bacterium]